MQKIHSSKQLEERLKKFALRKDFTHDINKCRKEAKESLYWLNLLYEVNELLRPRMKDIIEESEELVKIFQSAVFTAKSK